MSPGSPRWRPTPGPRPGPVRSRPRATQRRLELPWEATVVPSLIGASLRALPPQTRRRRQAGLRNVRRPGEGRLFEGLREWVPGDDTRIIDWKATARRGKPIARQYEDER